RRQPENALITEWRDLIEGLAETLRSRARIMLVTSPEQFALNESERVAKLMGQMQPPLQFETIVLNRVVADGSGCAACSNRARESAKAQSFMKRNFPKIPVQVGEDYGVPIIGADALFRFGAKVFANENAVIRPMVPRYASEPRLT